LVYHNQTSPPLFLPHSSLILLCPPTLTHAQRISLFTSHHHLARYPPEQFPTTLTPTDHDQHPRPRPFLHAEPSAHRRCPFIPRGLLFGAKIKEGRLQFEPTASRITRVALSRLMCGARASICGGGRASSLEEVIRRSQKTLLMIHAAMQSVRLRRCVAWWLNRSTTDQQALGVHLGLLLLRERL
jgi:hypothetical protein